MTCQSAVCPPFLLLLVCLLSRLPRSLALRDDERLGPAPTEGPTDCKSLEALLEEEDLGCKYILALANELENRIQGAVKNSTKNNHVADIASTAVQTILATHPHFKAAKTANEIRKTAIDIKHALVDKEAGSSDGHQLEQLVDQEVTDHTEKHKLMLHATSKIVLVAAASLAAVTLVPGVMAGGAGLHLAHATLAAASKLHAFSTLNLQDERVKEVLLLQACISETCQDVDDEPERKVLVHQSASVRLPRGGKPRPGQLGSLLQEGDWLASFGISVDRGTSSFSLRERGRARTNIE
eukprot:CAMPEP_0168424404 /NCGR_PEP_ID=MMETSP0228-20121227/34805_1 /TAXON_ID=133427 /ORGANISM="Protoceratium reticulatum, Strain CCCM 535 (=CCMP 1889)" /LENGTH=295 /DNA_ID=CAMNT_0008438393 /DNA_START=27 /DNA_END=914 /DNA_ORIENTATION=+